MARARNGSSGQPVRTVARTPAPVEAIAALERLAQSLQFERNALEVSLRTAHTDPRVTVAALLSSECSLRPDCHSRPLVFKQLPVRAQRLALVRSARLCHRSLQQLLHGVVAGLDRQHATPIGDGRRDRTLPVAHQRTLM